MTDLAVPAPAAPPPTPYDATWRLAQKVSPTEFVPKVLRGRPEAILACMLAGEELGLAPFKALSSIHIIEGRPTLSAELMRALVYAAGHELTITKNTNTEVVMVGRRRGGSRATVTWTLEDAQRAKLTGNPSWSKYPRAMLLARATSEVCRMLFPDVIGGLYTPEEAASIEGKAYDPPLADRAEMLVDPVAAHRAAAEADVVDAEVVDPDDEADRRWIDQATGEIHADRTPGVSHSSPVTDQEVQP